MQITIAKNFHGPRFGIGLSTSKVHLKTSRLRHYWRTINGLRLHANRRVFFIELWRPSFPSRKMIVNLYQWSER